MAPAATDLPTDPQQLLSEDGFGACVPEDHLDDIWLVMAKGRKLSRVPHVCMAGTCEDLPDIASWAAAQQFPEDIDLTRTEVVSRYADFVEAFCTPDGTTDDVPPVLLFAPDTPGAGALLTPPAGLAPTPRAGPPPPLRPNTPFPASWPPPFPGMPFAPPGAGVPTGGTTSSDGGEETPPGPGGPTDGSPDVGVIPLPPAVWLMLAALGLLAGIGRVRRPPAAGR